MLYEFLLESGERYTLIDTDNPEMELENIKTYQPTVTRHRPYEEPVPEPPTLEDLKNKKTEQINQKAAAFITGGFSCGDYRYDSQLEDQTNLQTATIGAMAAMSGVPGAPEEIPYRCFLADGSKGIIMHTPVEILTVFAAWGEHLARATAISDQLKKQIDAAESAEELENIKWPEEAEDE